METVLGTITSIPTRQAYADRCDGSGRELMRILTSEPDTASASTGAALELMFDQTYQRVMPAVSAFNEFHYQLDKINRSLPAAQRIADSVLAEKLANSVRRFDDHTRTMLDVRL
eukprot:1821406-Pleurochrysis_carterae.AAC.1